MINFIEIPKFCPICGEPTAQRTDLASTFLVCVNPSCSGKLINRLDHFCGKKGLDIKGLSKATLEKLIDWGWVESFADLYQLYTHRDEWVLKPGFGAKSVDKILNAIENSRSPALENFISALGIPLIGFSMSKELVKTISSYEDFRTRIQHGFDFTQLDGFADAKHEAICSFDYCDADNVAKYMNFTKEEGKSEEDTSLNGLTFVITGKLNHFKNRNELQDFIVRHGGKVSSTISGKVNFLINNDIDSTSAKNLAAKKLGIPIITEENFLKNTENF